MHIQAAGENMALLVDLGTGILGFWSFSHSLITLKVCLWDFHPISSQPSLFLMRGQRLCCPWAQGTCCPHCPAVHFGDAQHRYQRSNKAAGLDCASAGLDCASPFLCQAITDSVDFSKPSQLRRFLGFSLAVPSFLSFEQGYPDSASNVQWIPAHPIALAIVWALNLPVSLRSELRTTFCQLKIPIENPGKRNHG